MYNLCKALSILASMYSPQISKVYALSLDFKLVRKVIICCKIGATRVILVDGEVKLMLFNAMAAQVLLYGV